MGVEWKKTLMDNKNIIITIIVVIAFSWWFRFDTNCSSERCVAFDRFTGKFIDTSMQSRLDRKMTYSDYSSYPAEAAAPAAEIPSVSYEAAPAAEAAPSAEDYGYVPAAPAAEAEKSNK